MLGSTSSTFGRKSWQQQQQAARHLAEGEEGKEEEEQEQENTRQIISRAYLLQCFVFT